MSEGIRDYTIEPRPSPPPKPPNPPNADEVAAAAGPGQYDPTTRLRCAAWQDRRFRNRVLIERKENAYRAWAREPGLDAQAVVDECDRARRTMSISGLVLICLLFPLAFIHLGVALTAAVAFLALAALHRVRPTGLVDGGGAEGAIGFRAVAVVAVLLLVPFVIALAWGSFSMLSTPAPDYAISEDGTAQPDPQYEPPSTAGIGRLIPWPVAAVLLLVVMVGIGCWARARRNRALNAIVDEGRRSARRLGESGVGTVPVGFYSDFSPFVGAGVRFDSWPLTLDLKPAAAPGALVAQADGRGSGARRPTCPGPELVETLYAGMRDDLARLSEEGDALSTHRKVDVADCAFVSGVRFDTPKAVRRRMLDAGGTGSLRADWVRALIHASHERVRHFLEAGVSIWEGQIVVTAFVRLSLHGGSLRVEGETFVMPPVSARYSVPEEDGPTGDDAGGRSGVLWSAVAGLFSDAGAAIGEFEADLASQARASRIAREHTMRIGDSLVDFAPRTSIRQLAADPNYQQLFQRHDVHRVTGAVTKRCLTSLARVLNSEGYDTSDLEGLVQNINLGLQNFGGTANVDGVFSVGAGNTIAQQPQAQRGRRAGSSAPQA